MKFSPIRLLAAIAAAATCHSVAAQSMTTELLASGLDRPIHATAPPGDDTRIFIAQQNGQVRIVQHGTLLATPYLSIVVPNGYELGLLGFALDPQFASNGRCYVSYTRPGDNASIVSRFLRSTTDPNRADPTSEVILIGPVAQPFPTHNIAWLGFGPDGHLYVATGDGGGIGDPGCRAQSGASLLGKILRIDTDGNAPSDNPFVGNPTFDDRIWAYGLRNPWRCSFDRATGDLWIGDVGQEQLEEINFEAAGGGGGRNYGWKIKEGTTCYATSACSNPPACTSSSLIDPIRTLATSTACSVIGGYVYRGCAMPELRGTYFHADFCTGRIWSFRYRGPGLGITDLIERTAQIGVGGQVVSFGEDADGELLICRNFAGEVHRVVPDATLVSSVTSPGSLGSHGLVPRHDVCGALVAGHVGTLRVRDGLPSAAGVIFFGLQAAALPLPLPGFGTLVPVPIAFQLPFVTDPSGAFSIEVPGGGTGAPIVLHHQAALIDLALPGVTLSNAVATQFE